MLSPTTFCKTVMLTLDRSSLWNHIDMESLAAPPLTASTSGEWLPPPWCRLSMWSVSSPLAVPGSHLKGWSHCRTRRHCRVDIGLYPISHYNRRIDAGYLHFCPINITFKWVMNKTPRKMYKTKRPPMYKSAVIKSYILWNVHLRWSQMMLSFFSR